MNQTAKQTWNSSIGAMRLQWEQRQQQKHKGLNDQQALKLFETRQQD